MEVQQFEKLREDAHQKLMAMHYRAGVGHLGGNLSCLDSMLTLFAEVMTPADRFVLSKGHSAGALYIGLWALGLLEEEELATFHQDGTRLPGHPPSNLLPGVFFGTGSLGHGLSLAVGQALALQLSNQSGTVYCLTSDGEWQEGSMWEAISFAVAKELSNLTILVDYNGWQGFTRTSEFNSLETLELKLKAFGLATERVDGHEPSAIRSALMEGGSSLGCIILETVKGKRWTSRENSLASHYVPPTLEDIENFRGGK
jgi:transketolase